MRCIGIDVPPIPGTEASGLSALAELFEAEAVRDVVTTSIDADVAFQNFDDFWNSQTPNNAPITKLIAAIAPKTRNDLRAMLQSELQQLPGGAVKYTARANAIKAHRSG